MPFLKLRQIFEEEKKTGFRKASSKFAKQLKRVSKVGLFWYKYRHSYVAERM